MNNTPLWLAEMPDDKAKKPPHSGHLKVQTLVVGGGITGLTTAYLLLQRGISVALVERYQIGACDSGHTTAHLTYMTDERLVDLARRVGKDAALQAWYAGSEAMELIRELVEKLDLDCDFAVVPGFLAHAVGDNEKSLQQLRTEEEILRANGFAVQWQDDIAPTGKLGIRFEGQMKLHAGKYLKGLLDAVLASGGQVFENTEVQSIEDEPRRATTANGSIEYDHLVIATHMPLQGNQSTTAALLFQTKLAAYSSYAFAATLPTGTLPEMIWSDTADPFLYLRIDRGEKEDRVIIGGEDHKTGTIDHTEDCFARLQAALNRTIPQASITHRWTGQVVETVDGLPYIGEFGDAQFIATGFSGNGYTFGTLAAMMVCDSLTGQKERHKDWWRIFSPTRKTWSAALQYMRENSDFPLHWVRDRLIRTDRTEATEDALPQKGGKVLWMDEHPLACFRESSGELKVMSAICPHLGCVVHWNDADESWDCPCHGSRFTPAGEIITGPSEQPLKQVDAKVEE